MFNRYWNFTTCISSNNPNAIEQKITHLLEQEGCRRLTQLPQHEGSLEQLQAVHPWEQSCNPWIVSLFAGKSGWTIIKTSPNELLCHRAVGASRPRLSALTIQMGCDAMHFAVHYSVEGILLEANTTGNIFTSGLIDRRIGEKYQVYDAELNVLENLSKFSLLEVSQPIQAAMKVNQDPELERKRAKVLRQIEENSEELPDQFEVEEVLEGHMPRIDHALAEVMDGSQRYWYVNNLVYHAYAKPQQLEADGARLLYFQPPTIQNLTGEDSTHNPESDTESDLFVNKDDIPW